MQQLHARLDQCGNYMQVMHSLLYLLTTSGRRRQALLHTPFRVLRVLCMHGRQRPPYVCTLLQLTHTSTPELVQVSIIYQALQSQ